MHVIDNFVNFHTRSMDYDVLSACNGTRAINVLVNRAIDGSR